MEILEEQSCQGGSCSHETTLSRSVVGKMLAVCLLCSLFAGMGGGVIGVYYAPQVLAHLGPSATAASASLVPATSNVSISEDSATVTTVKKVSSSVVSIIIKKDLSKIYSRSGSSILPFDNFFDFGFPNDFKFVPRSALPEATPKSDAPVEKQAVGGGSGFIVSADGMILTNKHVVSDPEADYIVVTSDGQEHAAKILAQDEVNDLAIIKIEASGLTPVELGDSAGIQIGQTVIAIGNTLGEYKNTVTRGVISGINRVVTAADGRGASEVIQEAIQTDAAINPGNSGGPLLNLAGQVIGINTAVNSEGQSIGFALPINTAKRSIDSVKKFGRIIRPYLGVRYVMVDGELAKKNNLSYDYGALIQGNASRKELGIVSGGPAEMAGLGEGDIILEVNGQKLNDGHALPNEIAKYAPGDTVRLKVLARGQLKDLSAKLEEFKDPNAEVKK